MRKLLTILPILSLFLYFSFSQKPRIDKNPYQILFDYINFGTLKGNVLINESTRTFGCGTAAMEYSEKLRKSGLDKFYDKYGYIYADKAQIEKVTAKNGIKFIWFGSESEGSEIFFKDKKIDSNKKLKDKYWKETSILSIVDKPISMSSVDFEVSYKDIKTENFYSKVYSIQEIDGIWKLQSIKFDNTIK